MSNTKKKRRVGRPKLSERTVPTALELDYCRLRAKGMSVEKASEALEQRPEEMGNRERRFPVLREEIARLRGEMVKETYYENIELLHKTLQTLHDSLMKKVDGLEELSVSEITKSSELLDRVIFQMSEIKNGLDLQPEECPHCGGGGSDSEITVHDLVVSAVKSNAEHHQMPQSVLDSFLAKLEKHEVPRQYLSRWREIRDAGADPELVVAYDQIRRLQARIKELEQKNRPPIVEQERQLLQ